MKQDKPARKKKERKKSFSSIFSFCAHIKCPILSISFQKRVSRTGQSSKAREEQRLLSSVRDPQSISPAGFSFSCVLPLMQSREIFFLFLFLLTGFQLQNDNKWRWRGCSRMAGERKGNREMEMRPRRCALPGLTVGRESER